MSIEARIATLAERWLSGQHDAVAHEILLENSPAEMVHMALAVASQAGIDGLDQMVRYFETMADLEADNSRPTIPDGPLDLHTTA